MACTDSRRSGTTLQPSYLAVVMYSEQIGLNSMVVDIQLLPLNAKRCTLAANVVLTAPARNLFGLGWIGE